MRHHHHHHHGGGGGFVVATSGTGSSAGAVLFLILALGELGGGAAFTVAALSGPRMNLGFIITGPVLAFVGLVMLIASMAMFSRAANARRLRATGVPGQAQVFGVRQTGMYVNRQPQVELQLQITTGMNPPYPLTVKQVVPMMLMGRLTNGQPLPVMVDPTRPDNVVILWERALAAPMGLGAPPGGFGQAPGGYGPQGRGFGQLG